MGLAVVFAAGVVAGVAVGVRLLRAVTARWGERLLDRWLADESVAVAADSVARSDAVLRGRITEQLAPLLDDFGFAPADARFIGTPIDFVVFDGLADVRAGRAAALRRVVLVDVKTGGAGLSTLQRKVRACVEAGAVATARLDG